MTPELRPYAKTIPLPPKTSVLRARLARILRWAAVPLVLLLLAAVLAHFRWPHKVGPPYPNPTTPEEFHQDFLWLGKAWSEPEDGRWTSQLDRIVQHWSERIREEGAEKHAFRQAVEILETATVLVQVLEKRSGEADEKGNHRQAGGILDAINKEVTPELKEPEQWHNLGKWWKERINELAGKDRFQEAFGTWDLASIVHCEKEEMLDFLRLQLETRLRKAGDVKELIERIKFVNAQAQLDKAQKSSLFLVAGQRAWQWLAGQIDERQFGAAFKRLKELKEMPQVAIGKPQQEQWQNKLREAFLKRVVQLAEDERFDDAMNKLREIHPYMDEGYEEHVLSQVRDTWEKHFYKALKDKNTASAEQLLDTAKSQGIFPQSPQSKLETFWAELWLATFQGHIGDSRWRKAGKMLDSRPDQVAVTQLKDLRDKLHGLAQEAH